MTILSPPKIHSEPAGEANGTADELIRGVFEPVNSFLLRALARNKLILTLLTVTLALLGAVYGTTRDSTFTAAATLQVGQVNPNSPGFFGYVQSAASLATAFSRAIYAEPVLSAVQRKLALKPTAAIGRLSAEPIPASPTFRVIATGSSRTAAVELANVAASAVIAYETHSNNTNPQASSLLHEYRGATLALHRAEVKVERAGKGQNLRPGELALAEADRSAAKVRVEALSNAYTSAVANRAPASGLVTLLAGATSASSDHSSNVQSFGLTGALAGLLAGCAAALALERRREKRLALAMPDARGGGASER